ncbi:hypothetical protein [Streptomyces erythrochromogenes]|uniref:hypothetical protein n=1 Tax=Streptomyces erythrochromogenes TaxID=285574 RepID=UPI00381A1F88
MSATRPTANRPLAGVRLRLPNRFTPEDRPASVPEMIKRAGRKEWPELLKNPGNSYILGVGENPGNSRIGVQAETPEIRTSLPCRR